MPDGEMQRLRFGRVLVLASATAFLGLVPPASGAQAPECLIEVHDDSGAVADGGTVCAVAPAGAKFCTIMLQLCHNVGTCSAEPLKKKARTTGQCNPGKLTVSSTDSTCGGFTGIKVHTKKRGKSRTMGKCRIHVQAHAGHGQNDVDKVTLECMPSGSSCGGASPSGAFLDRPDAP
jgi:hypothetical protein